MELSQRREMLEANSERFEERTYSKSLTPEDLDKARMEFSQLAIEISQKKDQLREAMAEIKAEIKPMSEKFEVLLGEIKSRSRIVRGTLYDLADHDEGMMGTYDENGNLIGARRLTPEENQMSIHSVRTLRHAQNG